VASDPPVGWADPILDALIALKRAGVEAPDRAIVIQMAKDAAAAGSKLTVWVRPWPVGKIDS